MISKEDFDRYERIRRIGLVNMFDVPKVVQLTGLTRVQVLTIMKRYEAIRGEYYAPEPTPEPETVTCFMCHGEYPETEVMPFDRLTGDAICTRCIERRRIVSRIPRRYVWRNHERGDS
jgi:hypothetical protein